MLNKHNKKFNGSPNSNNKPDMVRFLRYKLLQVLFPKYPQYGLEFQQP